MNVVGLIDGPLLGEVEGGSDGFGVDGGGGTGLVDGAGTPGVVELSRSYLIIPFHNLGENNIPESITDPLLPLPS